MEELDDAVYEQIQEFSKQGNWLLDRNCFDYAIAAFNKALDLVPFPRSDWEASLWIYTALGDTFFLKGDFQQAADAFRDAYNCPDATDNPFVNLRLGQSLFELEQLEKAADFLLRAYMLDGTKIFRGENKKYITHLRKKFDL